MILNRKAHIDPLCIIPTTLLLIVGGIVLSSVWAGDTIWMPVLITFAALSLVSPLIKLFHHGLKPISGIITVLMVIVAIFLLRTTLGNPDPVGEFYMENLVAIIPLVLGMDIVNMLLP